MFLRPGFLCRTLAASLVVLLTIPSSISANAQAYVGKPKLVVIIVIDQFRGDYLNRQRDQFKNRGFNLFMNQGAWFQIRPRRQELAGEAHPVYYAGRAPAAAPATGLARIHQAEQRQLVQAALSAATAESSAHGAARAHPAPAPQAAVKQRNKQ